MKKKSWFTYRIAKLSYLFYGDCCEYTRKRYKKFVSENFLAETVIYG